MAKLAIMVLLQRHLLFLVSTAVGVAGRRSRTVTPFEAFVRGYRRSYAAGTKEYETRRALFETHVAQVAAVNGDPARTWHATVNSLADYAPHELAMLRGYRRHVRPGAGDGGGRSPVEFLTKSVQPANTSKLPHNFSWIKVLNATSDIQDQGQCGSCWAFSSATVLRAHSELFRKDRKFSVQQIVSCTENPLVCGGSGGCEGATAELAMDYVMRTGCLTDDEHPYTETDTTCKTKMKSRQLGLHPTEGGDLDAASFAQVEELAGTQFGMLGWRRLPENRLEPVLQSLYDIGPLVVSMHAGAEWNLYSSGIMDACPKDIVIDHAVMLLGFGSELGTKFWQIQNSWGPSWGEGGYIRVQRSDNEDEKEYCGWDTSPEMGSGCSDGPSKVWVCGHCGILNDVVVPHFALSEHGWWSKHGGKSGGRNALSDTQGFEAAASLAQRSFVSTGTTSDTGTVPTRRSLLSRN